MVNNFFVRGFYPPTALIPIREEFYAFGQVLCKMKIMFYHTHGWL